MKFNYYLDIINFEILLFFIIFKVGLINCEKKENERNMQTKTREYNKNNNNNNKI